MASRSARPRIFRGSHRAADCLTKAGALPPSGRTSPQLTPPDAQPCGTEGKSAARIFPGCLRLDRQRVHGSLEFRVQRQIDHAMTFDPALPFEGRRHNIDPEMRLAARPVAGMALMQM